MNSLENEGVEKREMIETKIPVVAKNNLDDYINKDEKKSESKLNNDKPNYIQ